MFHEAHRNMSKSLEPLALAIDIFSIMPLEKIIQKKFLSWKMYQEKCLKINFWNYEFKWTGPPCFGTKIGEKTVTYLGLQ